MLNSSSRPHQCSKLPNLLLYFEDDRCPLCGEILAEASAKPAVRIVLLGDYLNSRRRRSLFRGRRSRFRNPAQADAIYNGHPMD